MLNPEQPVGAFVREERNSFAFVISQVTKEQIKRPKCSLKPSLICVLVNNVNALPSCLAVTEAAQLSLALFPCQDASSSTVPMFHNPVALHLRVYERGVQL